jgi:hypothetical protein
MDNRHLTPIQTLIAEYLTQLADWRRMRFQDDLRDPRNLRSAEGIEMLAAHIRSLPKTDARVKELDRLCRRGEQIEVGQQAAYEIGRFRFFIPDTELDAFVDEIVDLARADANERGRFGGKQVPGDEPWG